MKSIPGLEKRHRQRTGRKRKHLPRLFFSFVAATEVSSRHSSQDLKGKLRLKRRNCHNTKQRRFQMAFCFMAMASGCVTKLTSNVTYF